MKILIVDDDKIIRQGMKKIISRLFTNHEIINDFQNGLVALDYIKNNKVDLVITDIKMPIMTGDRLIEETTKILEEPPVFLILSGYDEFIYVRDTMKLGAFNYLLKPIQEEELRNVIEDVEIKIKKDKNKINIIKNSEEILRREFFKSLLFAKDEQSFEKYKYENIQFEEKYIYKIFIVENKEDINGDKITEVIKKINTDLTKDIEVIYFKYKSYIYLVTYIDKNKIKNYRIIFLNVDEIIKKIIGNKEYLFISEVIKEIYKIRSLSLKFRSLNNSCKDLNKLIIEEELKESSKEKTVIKLVKSYIFKNYNNNISLKEVADYVYLSQNHLSELFKKEVGQGFYEFLTNYRINVAKDILKNTNIKVYEVANKVGYSDSISFGRAFKKIEGRTPNSFRNSIEG